MKKAIVVGDVYEYTVTVTDAMAARLNGEPVHPFYATSAMISDMEWAARQHILGSLEDGEEGVGCEVRVRHLNPTPVGAVVRVRSEVTGITREPNGTMKIASRVDAWNDRRKIGEGELVQAIVTMSVLEARAQSVLVDTDTASLSSDDPGHPAAFTLSIKGHAGASPCTRYDEWLVCDGEIRENGKQPRLHHQGPFLVRDELVEIAESLEAVAEGQKPGYTSDFLETILGLEARRLPDGRISITVDFNPPEKRDGKQPVTLTCTTESIRRFCRHLHQQLEAHPSLL